MSSPGGHGFHIDPFQIIVRGDLGEVLKLIESGVNVNQVRWSGYSMLHRAAQMGYTDICQVLIMHGADVNMKSIRGWYTPLHCALAHGYGETAEFLLEKGAQPWAKSKYKEDPFDYGAKKGYKAITVDLRAKLVKMEMVKSLKRHNEMLITQGQSQKSSKHS